MWKGWTRGTAAAEMLAPLHRTLTVDAMGWTGSTPASGVGSRSGHRQSVRSWTQKSRTLSRFRGKIVLMKPEGVPRKSFWMHLCAIRRFPERSCNKAGAVAVIGGQGGFKAEGMHLTHTGILGFADDFAIPVVDMTTEDEGQLERLSRLRENRAPAHQRAKHFYRRSRGDRQRRRRNRWPRTS